MPTYTFLCERCDVDFEVYMTLSSYNPSQNCPTCNKSDKTCRNYQSDNVSGNVSNRTVGIVADKNTSKMSEDEKEHLWRKHNAYRLGPKPDLPPGMERIDKKNPTFEDAKKRSKRKIKNLTKESIT